MALMITSLFESLGWDTAALKASLFGSGMHRFTVICQH